MRSLYLLIDLFAILFPVLFSFHPRIQFFSHWKAFLKGNIAVTAFFVVWDAWFTQRGVWGFNPRYVLGIYFLQLPLEEILFFICIPFSCVFTFYCLGKINLAFRKSKMEKFGTVAFFSFLVILGLANVRKDYTLSACLSTGLLGLAFRIFFNPPWLGRFFISYLILLIPFLVVNGILTGTGLQAPVVWYNPQQFLGWRVGTIPAEDFIYGMELQLLNVIGFEWMRSKPAGLP